MVKLLNTDVELEEKFECGLSEDNECNNILTPEEEVSIFSNDSYKNSPSEHDTRLSEDDEYTTDQSKSGEEVPDEGHKLFNVKDTDYESELETDNEVSKLHNVDKCLPEFDNFHDDESEIDIEIRRMSNTNVDESFTDAASVNYIGNADAVIGVVLSLVDAVVKSLYPQHRKSLLGNVSN